ncbi:MAG: hypothetical protein HY228_02035 [Candidatus Yonathbacteria bacterium]|nr:hypothetical protein [Candidatus Yonathbacteria bacterium]
MVRFGMAKYVLIGALSVFILGITFLVLEERRKDQRENNKVVVSGNLVVKGNQVCVESADSKFPVLSCWERRKSYER